MASAITVEDRDDGRVREHQVDDALQVGVGAGDHPGHQVAGAGDGVRLEHLGDRGQVGADGVVAAAGELVLADLQGEERGHRVAEGRGGEVRAPRR